MAQDTRQANRLRNLPPIPSFPAPPDLAQAYTTSKTAGLTEVFRRHDQNVRVWADQVALLNQRAHRATLDAIQSGSPGRADAGWSVYDFVRREGSDSQTQQQYGRRITVEPVEWRTSWELGFGRTWLGQTGWDLSKYAQSPVVAAPRTFRITFDESPLPGWRAVGRLTLETHIVPGDSILLPSGQTITAVQDAVRVVVRRVLPGEYLAWLESAETQDPADVEELHAGLVLARLL